MNRIFKELTLPSGIHSGLKRSKKIVVNTFSLTSTQIFTKATNFILLLYLTRHTGTEGSGKYFTALSLHFIFLIVADFGISNLLVRDISRDKNVIKEYISRAITLKIILSLECLRCGVIFRKWEARQMRKREEACFSNDSQSIEKEAKAIFRKQCRKEDSSTAIVIGIGICLITFPALSITGFFFEFIAQWPMEVHVFLSLLGGVFLFCFLYDDLSFWRYGVLPGIITGPLVYFATIFYTYNRESIWNYELLIPLFLGAVPGYLIWYFPIKKAALQKIKLSIFLERAGIKEFAM